MRSELTTTMRTLRSLKHTVGASSRVSMLEVRPLLTSFGISHVPPPSSLAEMQSAASNMATDTAVKDHPESDREESTCPADSGLVDMFCINKDEVGGILHSSNRRLVKVAVGKTVSAFRG